MIDAHDDIDLEEEIKDPDAVPLPVTALLLCGGRSKRMGRPKAFLPFEGTTMISHILGNITGLFREILLVSNEPEDFEDSAPGRMDALAEPQGAALSTDGQMLLGFHEPNEERFERIREGLLELIAISAEDA